MSEILNKEKLEQFTKDIAEEISKDFSDMLTFTIRHTWNASIEQSALKCNEAGDSAHSSYEKDVTDKLAAEIRKLKL